MPGHDHAEVARKICGLPSPRPAPPDNAMSLVVAKKDSPLSVIPVAAALAAGAKLVVHAERELRAATAEGV